MKKSATKIIDKKIIYTKIIDKNIIDKKIIDTNIDTSYEEKLRTIRNECQSYIDDNLGKLNKKVKELSDSVSGAFDILKDFDKILKDFEKMRRNDESRHQLTAECLVEIREHHEEHVAKVRFISEDLAELEKFVDNAAEKLNLPKMRGKKKIKIKR